MRAPDRSVEALVLLSSGCRVLFSAMHPATPDDPARLGLSSARVEITPVELAARLAGAVPAPTIIDVREPHEWSIARLPDARLIPLSSLPRAASTLDRDAEIVVYCHHGMRSAAAQDWLLDRGFARVANLAGGIDRWSLDVDPATRRY